jgi:hypothetical protein
VPLSKQLGKHFATHWNVGVSVLPHALAVDPPQSARLVSWFGCGSLVWQAADAVNLLAELLVLRDAEIGAHGVEHRTRAVFDPAIRVGWNGPASVQWVGGIGFPIGLTRDTDDFGVLLYMSVEHAVTAAAREERRW